MRRRFSNLAAGLSFVLLIAMCFTWAHSFLAHDTLSRTVNGGSYRQSWSVTVLSGSMIVERDYSGVAVGQTPAEWGYSTGADSRWLLASISELNPAWNLLGFSLARTEWGEAHPPNAIWVLTVPLWFFAMLLSILPVRWFIRHRQEHRRLLLAARGYCPACRADLRTCYDAKCPSCAAMRWKAAT